MEVPLLSLPNLKRMTRNASTWIGSTPSWIMGYNFFTLVLTASSSFETVNLPVQYKFLISLLMLVCKPVKACAHKYLSSIFKSNNFFPKSEKTEAKTLQISIVSNLTPYIARIKTFPLAKFLTLGRSSNSTSLLNMGGTVFNSKVLWTNMLSPCIKWRSSLDKLLWSVGIQIVQHTLKQEMALVHPWDFRAKSITYIEQIHTDVQEKPLGKP